MDLGKGLEMRLVSGNAHGIVTGDEAGLWMELGMELRFWAGDGVKNGVWDGA